MFAHLHPEPLTPQAFAAYGTVVAPFAHGQPPAGASAINGGSTWRLDLLADLDLHQGGGTPLRDRVQRRRLQVSAGHGGDGTPHPGQPTLLPLDPARFVVVERHGAPGTAVDCEVGDGVWLEVG